MCSGKLAPHEGKELALMLTGKKKLALFFSDDNIPCEFLYYIERGIFKVCSLVLEETPVALVASIIFRPVHQNYAEQLANLLKISCAKFDPAIEWEIGKLLGYPEKDILFYIDHGLQNMNNIHHFNEKFDPTFSLQERQKKDTLNNV